MIEEILLGVLLGMLAAECCGLHGDGVSRPDTRQLGGVPSRHPRVSNQDEIVLMLVTGGTGQHHAVRIRERNPHPLARTTIEAADWPAFVRVTALTPGS